MIKISNKDSYNQIAKKWDIFRKSKEVDNCIINFSKLLPSEAKILDIGCGSGYPIDYYLINKNFRVIGIDISKNMIKIAKKIKIERRKIL